MISFSPEQLLYHEARLLDGNRYRDWLELLAPDLRYWAPARAAVPRAHEIADESKRLALFDENKASLTLRVARLETGSAWIEVPPTRTRRMITNVTTEVTNESECRVVSNFILFRSRGATEEWMLVGCREDRWSRSDRWLLRERRILFDHAVLENVCLFL